jgi:Icc-related predicted phosphoesterase
MDAAYFRSNWKNWNSTLPDADAAATAAAAAAAALSRVATVLVDQTAVVAGVRIHGSPWVESYAPWKTGFNRSDEQLRRMWGATLPLEGLCDLLVTHSPPYGIGDRGSAGKHKGSRALRELVMTRVKPLFHVFGHEHADCGIKTAAGCTTTFINASCVSDYYHVGSRRCGHVIDIPKHSAH